MFDLSMYIYLYLSFRVYTDIHAYKNTRTSTLCTITISHASLPVVLLCFSSLQSPRQLPPESVLAALSSCFTFQEDRSLTVSLQRLGHSGKVIATGTRRSRIFRTDTVFSVMRCVC